MAALKSCARSRSTTYSLTEPLSCGVIPLLRPHLQAVGGRVGGLAGRRASVARLNGEARDAVDAEHQPFVGGVLDGNSAVVHGDGAVRRRGSGVSASALGEADAGNRAAAGAAAVADALAGHGGGDEREEESSELHFECGWMALNEGAYERESWCCTGGVARG